MKIDLDQIRDLLAVFSQTEITELTIESGDQKITLKKSSPSFVPTTIEVPQFAAPVAVAQRASAPAPAEAPKPEPAKLEPKAESNGNYIAISSPMVGTFYRAPSPAASPFVEVGDRVAVGQTVCIIEAMKLMNDLPAEVSGRVVKVCVENGTTVEYGQPLFMVDPNG